MRLVPLALAGSLALLPGCYLFHGFGGDVSLPDAGPRRDAGPGTGPTFDGGVGPMRRDAGPRDAGMPRPSEPDPDMGPGSRPSDYPDADDWEDPPAPVGDSPCCTLGEPTMVTSRDEGMSLQHAPPIIAFGPGRWGLLVSRYYLREDPDASARAVVYEVDRNGGRLDVTHELEMPAYSGAEEVFVEAWDLEWAEGRWAVAISGEHHGGPTREGYARLYDADFVPDGPWTDVGMSSIPTPLARLTVGDDWLAASSPGPVVVTSFGGSTPGSGTALMAHDHIGLHAVGMRSRVALLASAQDSPSELFVVGPGPDYAYLGGATSALPGGWPAAMGRLRDVVVTASIHELEVSVEVFDPFTVTAVGRPQTLTVLPDVEATSTLEPRAIDVAGSDKLGLAAICYGVPGPDRGTGDRIDLQIVDARGRPWAAPVTVFEGGFRGSIVNCSLGSDGHGFLVGWWDGSVLWVRRVDVAM